MGNILSIKLLLYIIKTSKFDIMIIIYFFNKLENSQTHSFELVPRD
jgi:hypothetical protein